MKIVADVHIPFVKEFFGQNNEVVLLPGRAMTAADIRDAEMLLVRSITPVNAALLGGSQVKFVGSVTAGDDHVDKAWLEENGIRWCAATGFNAPPVADYVVSVMAAMQRRQCLSQYQCKVAVIGVGHVGRRVVDHLRTLGCQVVLCDPFRAEHEPDFEHTPLEAIADVDLICLHVPLTKEGKFPTWHFIDEAFLKRQMPGCVILNASRGAVVDSSLILADAHFRWCLDVWEHEPHIDKKVLQRAEISTPHIAGYSVQSKKRGIEMIYRVACGEKIIPAAANIDIDLPTQVLRFAGKQHHWQDIVMGIFNPLTMTALMKTQLFASEETGFAFDQLRNQFNYRHEFAYTRIESEDLLPHDKKILGGLGIISIN